MTGKIQTRLAVLGALAALVAVLVPAGLASGNAELDAIDFLDCGDEAAETEDAAAASALGADGFSCTRLFNKPTIDSSNPQQVGQMWFKLDGTILQMRVLFFGGVNTGFGDSKICLDDDGNPINNVAMNDGKAAPTCIGSEFQSSVKQGGDNGPTYSGPVKSASQREEPEGKLEVAVENLTPDFERFGGVTVGGWNVNLGPDTGDLFTEVLPHFNLDGFSIVAYFQPLGQRIFCGEPPITLEDGDLTASFTLEGIEGLENTDPDCFKEIVTAIDNDTGTVLFEPTGGGGEATFSGTISRKNELLDTTPETLGLDSVGLFIDTTPFDFEGETVLQACVLDDDGTYVPPADGWGYTRSEAVPEFTEDGHVFGVETHDLCGSDADPSLRF